MGQSVLWKKYWTNFFNKLSVNYDVMAFTATPGLKYIDRMEQEMVTHALPVTQGMMLDVGVGTGRFTQFYARRGIDVVGVDISFSMLKKINQKMDKNERSRVNLILADAENLPFRDHKFNWVLCIRVVKYVPAPKRAIKEAARVIQRNGIMVFVDSVNRIHLPTFFLSFLPRQKTHLFMPLELKRILAQYGLNIVEIQGKFRIPFMFNVVKSERLVQLMKIVEEILDRIFPSTFLTRTLFITCTRV